MSAATSLRRVRWFRRARRLTGAEWAFIVVLLLLAAGLRFWGLDYGQPDPAYSPSDTPNLRLPLETPVHPDEYFFVSVPLQMAVSRYPNPKFYESPSYTINVNFVLYLLTGTWYGIDPATLPIVGQRQIAPFPAYFLGRVHIVLAGIVIVAAAYATARRLAGRYAAAATGLLTAVSFTLVQHSHYATPSTDAAAWAAVCVWACLAALQQRRANGWIFTVAAVSAGLAASTRYNVAGVSMMVFFTGLVLLARFRSRRTVGIVLLGWLLVPLVFVVATPGIIFDFTKFAQDFDRIFSQFLTTGFGFSENYLTDPWLSLTFHLRYLVVFSLGITATFAAALGVWAAWRLRARGGGLSPQNTRWLFVLMLVAYLVIYTLVVLRNRRPSYNDHMILPIIPHLAVLAGLGTAWLYDRVRLPRRLLAPALVGLLVLPTLIPALQYDAYVSQPDTRYQMQAWVYEHIPRGANIHLSAPYNVPLDPADYTTTQTYIDDFTPPSALREAGADYVILSDAWLHDVLRSSEFMPPDFVTRVADYYASYDAELPLVARIDRPTWFGPNWIMHTASYWHHPGLSVYCLTPEACAAID